MPPVPALEVGRRLPAGTTFCAVRTATHADVEPLSRLLASAFEDDPVQAWLFPSVQRRWRRLKKAFELELRHWIIDKEQVFVHQSGLAVAAWLPPDDCRVPLRSAVRIVPAYTSLIGRRAVAAFRGLSLMEQGHPREPHRHLIILATHPERQGRGLASSLLGERLRLCDEEGVPAYLESSKRENVAFYARHGFEVTEEIRLPGGPPLWLMLREPRSPVP